MRYVKSEKIIPGMVLGLDVTDLSGQIAIKKGLVLSQSIIDRIKNDGYQGVVIDDTISSSIEIEDDFNCYKYSKDVDCTDVKEFLIVAMDIVDDVIRRHPSRISIQKIICGSC